MILPGSTRWQSLLLKTGQITQYNSLADDGLSQKGITKAYTVLTTGQYSGNFNIDLLHYTSGAGAVTFNNTLHTIVDTGAGLAIFKTADVILTDSANNPGPFTITTGNVAGTITCTGATFVNETPAGTVSISKREVHSNACVLDNNTGLMWSRVIGLIQGGSSNGTLPFYDATKLYNIFTYAAAANAGGGLAGHTDWRVPNMLELVTLMVLETSGMAPATGNFPTWTVANLWSSNTVAGTTTNGWFVGYATGSSGRIGSNAAKTGANLVILVRG